jgi:hypothetical protein
MVIPLLEEVAVIGGCSGGWPGSCTINRRALSQLDTSKATSPA